VPETIVDILRRAKVEEMTLGPAPEVAPHTSLGDVCRLLEADGRSAAVVRDGDQVVGIFTQRDLLYRAAQGALDLATPIAELMTRSPRTFQAERPLAEALDAMVEGGYRQLPLVDAGGQPQGLLSTRDVLSFIARRFPEETLNLPPRLHQMMPTSEGA
jgi:CBS domain-containing protein